MRERERKSKTERVRQRERAVWHSRKKQERIGEYTNSFFISEKVDRKL